MAVNAFAPVSVILASMIFATRFPERPLVLIALNNPPAPVSVVYVPAAPIVTVPLRPVSNV